MNSRRGISAIEIIVLILVLAVVVVIAIPAWRSHRARDRIADAFKVTDAAKLVVMEAATVHGGLAHIKAGELSYSPAAAAGQYVAHVTIADDGRITMSTRDTGATPDPVLVLTPSEDSAGNNAAPISWICNVVVGDPDLFPANCRTAEPAKKTPTSAPSDAATAAAMPPAHTS
ncbi:pilin [Rhodanobacter sp. MP7CTX1]|jgi:type IV pilus assembly protein PilA|uniref:pilin n=1 Tax=Rhodanobacter sp. MP7CTX1 TaxID=2723084 RepID=UPI001611DA7D|nr:pilin [Rhodanobacter sp. MP7CTX1]MBB6187259.1 type IV pilus assembly protein PilA [Rhodanobacter sp. MP7CTX1]